MQMKHNQNARGRIPYTLALFLLYEWIIRVMNLSINTSIYGLFFMLILSYYVFGIFTLRERYSVKEFLISISLNSAIFFILLIFHKDFEIIFYCLMYTGLQNLVRYILGKLYKHNIRVLILGDETEERRVKKGVVDNLEYSYVGFVSDKNSNALGKIVELQDIIKQYEVTKVIYIKDSEDQLLNEIFKLKLDGMKVIDSDSFLQNVEGKIDVDRISKKWFLESKGFDVLTSTLDKRIKRFIDISMALVVFLIGLPFMILTYFLLKYTIKIICNVYNLFFLLMLKLF